MFKLCAFFFSLAHSAVVIGSLREQQQSVILTAVSEKTTELSIAVPSDTSLIEHL